MSTITPTAAVYQPVLMQCCVELLVPALIPVECPMLVDVTVGLEGHSEALLRRFPHLQITGIDRDGEARALAGKRSSVSGPRIEIAVATYGQPTETLAERGLETVGEILTDLGASSLQLDETVRGFAYAIPETPLDMCMDQGRGTTVAQFVVTTSETEIARVLRTYGEEKFARQTARSIVKTREVTPLRITGELVDLIRATIPAPARCYGGNLAKRTFQALRVAVDDELQGLEVFLTAALDALRVGGRLVVESYQSLEDRLVKQVFVPGIHSEVSRGLSVIPTGYEPWLQDLTRGVEKADTLESRRSSRSQSVCLRAVTKLREMTSHEPGRPSPNPASRRKQ